MCFSGTLEGCITLLTTRNKILNACNTKKTIQWRIHSLKIHSKQRFVLERTTAGAQPELTYIEYEELNDVAKMKRII